MPTPAAQQTVNRIFSSGANAAPANRDLIRANGALAPNLRQSMVLLRFELPIRRGSAAEFLRIHLTEQMLKAGERNPYMADIFQPDRTGEKACPRCSEPLQQISREYTRCRNSRCENFGRRVASGPVRGIVDVVVTPDQICETDAAGVQWINGCILVLDRRYSETVLAQIYRTAGVLCEFSGWRLI